MSFKIEQIGERIKKFREMRNFTQDYVATQLGMTAQGYGKIERNEVEITLQKLHTIAAILGTSIQDIFSFDEKFVFHNQECNYIGVNHTSNNFSEIKDLYEARIADLQKEITYLRETLQKSIGK